MNQEQFLAIVSKHVGFAEFEIYEALEEYERTLLKKQIECLRQEMFDFARFIADNNWDWDDKRHCWYTGYNNIGSNIQDADLFEIYKQEQNG